ncbi:NADH dehydrogenase [ubiquinone] iron-sulfur protein 4, mitochondrial [Trichogramma pretiosum]|uniref:NADH dehydrogenase [ubiquinone] iron-sulfur protein 4, mitochondrial n=1 Tax=Trichogramma pretiosum TaxID=7493 RepID=UPI0006C96900|nr:NADH dehydrogenase [ubiquinone] iron-sulfur protein 4, mitochondrial [Trichogramma pretiosum]
MGSRALLIRNVNRFINNAQPCQHISSSSVLTKDMADVEKALQIHEPDRKTTKTFFAHKAEFQRKEAMKGLITIQSEENNVGIASGTPEEHIKTRTVRIYKPAKNAMQSGTDNINFWQISFDTRERWENPLMGWCSSGDPLQALRVNFETLEEAQEHCKKMGWKYLVQSHHDKDPMPRNYGTNFSWDKRTRVSTK